MLANAWLVIKALLVLAPFIMQMIKGGKIKEATKDEVLRVFEEEFTARLAERVNRAADARAAVPDDVPVDDSADRATRRKKTRKTGGKGGL
jgi:hypothetical protein